MKKIQIDLQTWKIQKKYAEKPVASGQWSRPEGNNWLPATFKLSVVEGQKSTLGVTIEHWQPTILKWSVVEGLKIIKVWRGVTTEQWSLTNLIKVVTVHFEWPWRFLREFFIQKPR